MSDNDSDYNGTDASMSGDEPLGRAKQTDAEQQAEFEDRCGRLAAELLFHHFELPCLEGGDSRRRVSGICGRFKTSLGDRPLDQIRQRIEHELSPSRCRVAQAQHGLLQTNRGHDLQPNDRVFTQGMGSLRDPDRLLRQRFQLICYAECLEANFSPSERRILLHTIYRSASGLLYLCLAEYTTRCCSPWYLEWIGKYRLGQRRDSI